MLNEIGRDFGAEIIAATTGHQSGMFAHVFHAPGVTGWCNNQEQKSLLDQQLAGRSTGCGITGGWGGIRTHETLAGFPVFKTGTLNRSATHPGVF
jgi:hypothetical protein